MDTSPGEEKIRVSTRKGVQRPEDWVIGALSHIGICKANLPEHTRGWISRLGLYVQYTQRGEWGLLQAGDGKWRPRIHLEYDGKKREWEVRKYDSGAWEELIQPTFELATWVFANVGVGEGGFDPASGKEVKGPVLAIGPDLARRILSLIHI